MNADKSKKYESITKMIAKHDLETLLVYGAGRYRFTDFVRVSALLTVLICIVAIILMPMLWPL